MASSSAWYYAQAKQWLTNTHSNYNLPAPRLKCEEAASRAHGTLAACVPVSGRIGGCWSPKCPPLFLLCSGHEGGSSCAPWALQWPLGEHATARSPVRILQVGSSKRSAL